MKKLPVLASLFMTTMFMVPVESVSASTADQSVVDVLIAHGEDISHDDITFGQFAQLLFDAAGIHTSLDECDQRSYTIVFPNSFAIVDDALRSLDMTLGQFLAQPLLVRSLLLLHISPSAIAPTQFIEQQGIQLSTFGGLTIVKSGSDSNSNGAIDRGEFRLNGNVVTEVLPEACNGWVYLIEGLIVPSTAGSTVGLIIDDLSPDPGSTDPFPVIDDGVVTIDDGTASIYQVLATGIGSQYAGLLLDASGIRAPFANCGQTGTNAGLPSYTVFFPSSDASFDAVLDALDLTVSEILARPALIKAILLYHVHQGSISPTQFTDVSTTRIPTMGGLTLIKTVSESADDDGVVEDGEYFINGYPVLERPIQACNGWVYLINGLLAPTSAIQTVGLTTDGSVIGGGSGSVPSNPGGGGGSAPSLPSSPQGGSSPQSPSSGDSGRQPTIGTGTSGSLLGGASESLRIGVTGSGVLGSTSQLSGQGWSLPKTGSESMALTYAALASLIAGAGVLVIRRRSVA